ncbi:MAG: ribonuclease T, partial [Candidatus Electrothrix sp. ATG2]|nr:ribonuclease T [Candidatus Electrothrix sp. ATG2]
GNGDEYFDDSLRVLAAINNSAVSQFLSENVGSEVDTADIRKAFDSAFGEGAGDRVKVKCAGDQGRLLIQELTITLKGEITETADIGALIRAGDPQSPGCSQGVIDPAGLQ